MCKQDQTPEQLAAMVADWQRRVDTECSQYDTSLAPGVCSICTDCQHAYDLSEADLRAGLENGSICEEGGFSWSGCHCCGSLLGGDRHAAHGFVNGDLCHLNVCTDCLLYLANGDLPQRVD